MDRIEISLRLRNQLRYRSIGQSPDRDCGSACPGATIDAAAPALDGAAGSSIFSSALLDCDSFYHGWRLQNVGTRSPHVSRPWWTGST